jgi:hypothetical protein
MIRITTLRTIPIISSGIKFTRNVPVCLPILALFTPPYTNFKAYPVNQPLSLIVFLRWQLAQST